MVSVCMATKNGARFIGEQIDSILPQLEPFDEIVVSDDGSFDATLSILAAYGDDRIRVIANEKPFGVPGNFERSLKAARGEFIFLSDQDDVWRSDKIAIMREALALADLVLCDCSVNDNQLVKKHDSFFALNRSGRGLLRNIVRNSYMGCCMAFRRAVLERALPFPTDIPVHDFWIGMIAEKYFRVALIHDALVYHRRHDGNASSTGSDSRSSLDGKISLRFKMLKNLLWQ